MLRGGILLQKENDSRPGILGAIAQGNQGGAGICIGVKSRTGTTVLGIQSEAKMLSVH